MLISFFSCLFVYVFVLHTFEPEMDAFLMIKLWQFLFITIIYYGIEIWEFLPLLIVH